MKSLLFDLDGTLLDTLQDLTDSVNHALSSEGLPLQHADRVRELLGNGYLYLVTEAAGEKAKRDEILAERLLKNFTEYYEIHCLDKTAPYAGIIDMLKKCRNRGWNIAVISNKGQQAASTLVKRFFGELVDFTVGESEGIRRKPAPDTLLQAMKKLRASKEETIFIGDSEVDLKAARAAGMRCISCLWGFRDTPTLLAAGAKHLCKSPQELFGRLEDWWFSDLG